MVLLIVEYCWLDIVPLNYHYPIVWLVLYPDSFIYGYVSHYDYSMSNYVPLYPFVVNNPIMSSHCEYPIRFNCGK